MKKKVLIFLWVFIILSSVSSAQTGVVKDKNCRAIFTRHEIKDNDSIEFNLGRGRGLQLRNRQYFEFIIPESFQGRIPDYAYIHHRKEFVYFKPDENGMDNDNPWIQTAFRNFQTGEWKIWADQFGSKKRSAMRPDEKPKKNTLYNFLEHVGNFAPDRVRIFNLAEGNPELAVASIHKLGLVFLSQKDSDPLTNKVFTDYEKLNRLTLRYDLDKKTGLKLLQNHSFEFVIPENFRNRSIFHIILKHRKDPIYAANPDDFDAFDPNAAYILCEARNQKTGYWHKWADRSSLAKFSEVRTADNPEDETLHNCLRTFGQIEPDRFRLTNVGKGDPDKCIANVHAVEIMFAPDLKNSETIEKIFTPDTSFSRPDLGRPVPLLGGGPRLSGRFPGALVLGKGHEQRIKAIENLPEKHQFETGSRLGENYQIDTNGDLLIKLPSQRAIESIELAIGDLDITSLEYNKDGYFGRSGKAEVSIFIEKQNRESIPLLLKNNLGMAGMVLCGGPGFDYLTDPGDRLRIVVSNDIAFLMGFRILLKVM
jgi:hypothetical protein